MGTEAGILGFALSLCAVTEPSPADAEILGEEPGKARVERVQAKLTFFDQYGRGYQSKAGDPEGPGSERLQVVQPSLMLTLRGRNPIVTHTLTGVVDIVSAASPDALDVVSEASRDNEAGTLDVTTSVQTTDRGTLNVRYGAHIEEHWRTGFAGVGYVWRLREETSVVSTSFNAIVDWFDDLHPRGWNDAQAYRLGLNANAGLVQVLSPTTLAMVSYGFTLQRGTLENGWNSVFVEDAPRYGCEDLPDQRTAYDCPNRRRENLPGQRLRHAMVGQLAQHLRRSRTTLKARYRYYLDDFGFRAHTLDTWAYQWIGRRMFLRFGYRFHHQRGNRHWRRSVLENTPTDRFATADSDLSRFAAHQPGVKAVVYVRPPGSASGGPSSFDLSVSRYIRTNGLHVNVFSLGYAHSF